MDKRFLSLGLHKRKLLSGLLLIFFIWSLFSVDWDSDLIHSGGLSTGAQMLEAMFHPDLSGDIILLALESSWITLSYAAAGMSLAILIAFFFGTLASGVLASSKVTKLFFRGCLGFMRAIHELVWAWLFVASIGLSPFAAIFALAIPYGGILGRIFADMLADIPQEPIMSLRTAGASRFQIFWYGYMPMVSAGITSYAMYRFECAIRSSAIMSFVGIGGLGYQIQLSLDDLHFDEVWTFMFFLIFIVLVIDVWSNQLRKRLVF